MSEPRTPAVTGVEQLTGGRRRWIDVLLVAAGGAVIATGAGIDSRLLVPGLMLAALGLLTPLLLWSGRNRGVVGALHLVPAEMAERHGALRAAASLEGVVDGVALVRAADDALLEVAALLGGRPPRGAAQRRFVQARTRALTDTAAELTERHDAWVAARAEVDALDPVVALEEAEPARGGPLVAVLFVLLLPAFLGWDVVRAVGYWFVALADGVALRLRTASRLVGRAAIGAAALARRARSVWVRARDELVAAASEAHHRASSARLRLRLRLRRARHAAASGHVSPSWRVK